MGASVADALRKTTALMNYLAEVTAASERDPGRDILANDDRRAPDPVIWLDELPEGVRISPEARGGVLLRLRPSPPVPEPRCPDSIADWVDDHRPRGLDARVPSILELGPRGADDLDRSEPPISVVQTYTKWSAAWRRWWREEPLRRRVKALYEQLESAAKILQQQDDDFECVLAVGLLAWAPTPEKRLYRHLVTEPLVLAIDRATAEIRVSVPGGGRRFEDKELLSEQPGYQPDRGRAARQNVLESERSVMDAEFIAEIKEWLGLALDQACDAEPDRPAGVEPLPAIPQISPSAAILVRPRSRALLAEAYAHIAAALAEPDAQVPVALAQLVMDTEAKQRNEWLRAQGAVDGHVLGEDPLFPLPTNEEQRRVLDLLEEETTVVVQGPPGTGKTHTIANLVSALLAQGQRVLVTSQKDQALKVLRDKIPQQLQNLCVLLAGGTQDANRELERGIESLSAAIASQGNLPDTVQRLTQQRHALRSESAELNSRVRALREVEHTEHPPVAPKSAPDAYGGRLADIVREVRENRDRLGWMPPVDPGVGDLVPLSSAELSELLALLRTSTPSRRARIHQDIPAPAELPTAVDLATMMAAEGRARETAHADNSDATRKLAQLGADRLRELASLERDFHDTCQRLGVQPVAGGDSCEAWVLQAIRDHLSGQRMGVWGHLAEVDGEATRLQDQLRRYGVTHVVDAQPVGTIGMGTARGLLVAGRALRDYLAAGGRLRKIFPSPAEKNAAAFRQAVTVDGSPPSDAPQLDAALHHLEADVAATQLIEKWGDAGVEIAGDRLVRRLSDLVDKEAILRDVRSLGTLQRNAVDALAELAHRIPISTVQDVAAVLMRVPAALNYATLELARGQVNQLLDGVQQRATVHSCPELIMLVKAIDDRDLEAYELGLGAVGAARSEQSQERRCSALLGRLRTAHTALASLLEQTATDDHWDGRLADLPSAWGWSLAEQFVRRERNAEEESRTLQRYDQVEDRIAQITAELAAAIASQKCLSKMTDAQVSALRGYGEHMSKVGAGTGALARQFRRAARAAMEQAKGAVPVWVVPLPKLLENIKPSRNSFDVIIVDEASQVGLEQLFLLWMAPRVIVVGDDKQCTPGENRLGRQSRMFESLNEHLGEIDAGIRMHFTSKSHLYGVLSARSGRDSVIRLREHFRCMPEIINWSSRQFYTTQAGLIPLRERKGDHLQPTKVVQVRGAYMEGRHTRRRNPVEADHIVAQLKACIADPAYAGKSFGVVVMLQSSSHDKCIEAKINESIPPEVRIDREIRVGSPANFQGDERDVVFMSLAVVEPPRAQRYLMWQQAYNVAASRAKDQLWVFTSLALSDYKPDDLRYSLLEYMANPPSVYGSSPSLEEISANAPHGRFESLFEQRVYRQIKERGYHVVPQYQVGSRRLDLVVVGEGGRLAVECDGSYWHGNPQDQISDARRDRELRRMEWEVHRIRESEFEFDADKELRPIWARLEERNIHPQPASANSRSLWEPATLPDDDREDEHAND